MTYQTSWRQEVDGILKTYKKGNEKFDCADLSIRVMVTFAYKYKLPVYFKDYKATKDPTISNDSYGFDYTDGNGRLGKLILKREIGWPFQSR